MATLVGKMLLFMFLVSEVAGLLAAMHLTPVELSGSADLPDYYGQAQTTWSTEPPSGAVDAITANWQWIISSVAYGLWMIFTAPLMVTWMLAWGLPVEIVGVGVAVMGLLVASAAFEIIKGVPLIG